MGKIREKFAYTEARGDNIRINFRFEGKLYRPCLDMLPTPKNLQYASNLAIEIRQKIKANVFHMADYFPELCEKLVIPTFHQMCIQWLGTKHYLADSTVRGYRKILNTHWLPYFAGVSINTITFGQLSQRLAEADFESEKTYNNCVTPIRGVFGLALEDGHIQRDPTLKIDSLKVQEKIPDPLEVDEIPIVLDGIRKAWKAYFILAIYTGMRTNELIELKWSDIDFRRNEIAITRAKVSGKVKALKNKKARTIQMNSMVKSALQKQKAETYMAGEYVLINPNTNQPIYNDKPPRMEWTRALKLKGIRHRSCYQTRSTSVCMQLTAGLSPYHVSEHHGHSIQVMMKNYAKWMKSDKELNKLEQFLQENKA